MTAVPSPSGIPHVIPTGRGLAAWVETSVGYTPATAVTSASLCLGLAEAWRACARQLDSRIGAHRPEPDWAENWFCGSCHSIMVGGRPADDECGCKAAAA